jgi:multidrug efflux pump subunit AcrA (membrane-fusion protein)
MSLKVHEKPPNSARNSVLARHAGVAYLLMGLSCITGCHERKKKQPPKPRSVSVLRLEPQTADVYREYVGRTAAFLSVDVKPQVTGYITGFYFREGHFVHKGERLFQIDPAPFRAQMNAASAQVAKSDADILRARALLAKARDAETRLAPLAPLDAVPRQQYADAVADVSVRQAELLQMQANRRIADASLEQARVQLSYATLRAPIAGIAGMRRLATGGLANPSDPEPLVTISQCDPIRVEFSVSDADYLRYLAAAARTPGKNRPQTVPENAPWTERPTARPTPSKSRSCTPIQITVSVPGSTPRYVQMWSRAPMLC